MPAETPVRLRPYQLLALDVTDQHRASGNRKALWVMPTGAGKTVCFGEYVRRADCKTLILAHREELLTQARDKLSALGIPASDMGIVGAGFEENGRRITIGSVQSLSRPKRLAKIAAAGIELVVVDEAHHRPADTYCRILDALPDAFELGVTATPDRADGEDLEAVYGPPVVRLGLPEMIRDRYLCDLQGIQVQTTTRLDGVHTRAGDFAADELSTAVNSRTRNKLIVAAWRRHAADRLTLDFCAGVQHAYDLAEAYRADGINAVALDGETDRDDRRHILRDYRAGVIRHICNCGVLTEGFDEPETSCIVLARPTQSRGLYVQMVGRGTRPAPGKPDCLVLDIADLTSKHSLTVQSLPKLIGRKGYESAWRAPRHDAEDDGSVEPFSLRQAITGPVVEKTVNLLGEAFKWERSPKGAGNYYMRMPGGTFWLALHDDGYAAGVIWNDGHKQELTHEHMPLDWAQTIAEQAAAKVRDGAAVLVDRRASWRWAEATDKQLWMLRKLRVKHGPAITKGEAADLISAAMAKRAS